MLRGAIAIAILAAYAAGCYTHQDARLGAAESFRDAAYSLIQRDEQQIARLNALHLGMTDQQVLAQAGPPTRREPRALIDQRMREVWTYGGELKRIGTLMFEDGRLIQIVTQ